MSYQEAQAFAQEYGIDIRGLTPHGTIQAIDKALTTDRFRVYVKVQEQLEQLGVSFRPYAKLDDLKQLLVATLQNAYKRMGFGKGVKIVIPPGVIVGQEGVATITNDKLHINLTDGLATVSLKFSGRQTFNANALQVLEHATIAP